MTVTSTFFDKTIQIGNSIANNVFTKTNCTFSTQNNQQKIEAEIKYTNLAGEPYDGREVTYEVELNNKQVAKGKGTTDSEGNLSLSFNSNTPTTFKSGHITTSVKLSPTEKVIKVLPVKAISQRIDVQFFPESGTFLSDIRNKVAFKAVGADGLGVDIKGTIVDNDGQEIAKLNSTHLGMGIFLLLPQQGKTYAAKITYPDGSEGKLDLPKPAEHGYTLSVYNNDTVTVKISTNDATFQANQNSEINLVVQSGGSIIYTAKTKLNSPVFAARIPRSRFPSGIAQFTLFSATGDPLNERVALIQNPDLLNIALSAEKASYAPREKVMLNINAKNRDDKPVIGAFSMSVTNESKVPVAEADENTILSNLLLTSDIKGYVEKPNYYFSNVSDKTRADLDVLMLTQGYRRFVWKQIMADTYAPLAFKPEKSLEITGHVKTFGGKAVPKGKVTIFSTTGGVFVMDTVTDENGAFAFRGLVFRDSVKFLIQARNAKGSRNVDIDLDNLSPQIVTANKNSADIEVNVNSALIPYLQNSKTQYDDFLKYGMIHKTIMLKTVTITEKKAALLKNSENLNGPGNADQTITGDQLGACATLTDCLIGKANFISFRQGVAYNSRTPNAPMLVVLDGMPMTDFDLDEMPASAVASVEVLRTSMYLSIYGSRAGNGVLIITTKRGGEDDGYKGYALGIANYHPKGYYQARVFYAPQYDDPKTNTQVVDLRTTIMWKPNIITDKNGQSSVSFFNADGKGTYKAVIEGIDSDGNIGRQVFRYRVE